MKKAKLAAYITSGSVAAILLTVNIVAIGVFGSTITRYLVGNGTADEETLQASRASGEELAAQIESEGIVLLKNQENLLPLSKDVEGSIDKVNVFGWSSTQWIGGGSGSGRVVSSQGNLNITTGLLEALDAYHIDYNHDLTDMYKKFAGERPGFTSGTLNTDYYQFHRLIEPSIKNDYSEDLLNGAKAYSDTAFVVLGRISGESNDAPKVQYKGTGRSSSPNDATRTYLEISTEEEELLTYVGANFDKVVVIINSTNTMELGFLDTIEGLDACLYVGATGINAAKAIPGIIYGDVTPSGRTTDTFAYEFESAASYANAGLEGERLYSNITSTSQKVYPYDGKTKYGNVGNDNARYPGVSYVDYKENIYIGYKWYETADVEHYWDDVGGYEKVVQFPFGYGLSYTDFEWEVTNVNPQPVADGKISPALTSNGKIEVTVRVTNIGEKAGKDVVQLYYTAPYNPGGIEKSSINLAAYAKTETLNPKQSQEVTLSFDVQDMASYDAYDDNYNDFMGYELDSGTYEIKLMRNAHETHPVVESDEAAHTSPIFTYTIDSNIQYKNDKYTGKEVRNLFTGADAMDGVSLDGGKDRNGDFKITYLTRSDFINTFPELSEARAITDEELQYNLYTTTMADEWKNVEAEAPRYSIDSGLKLTDSDGNPTELMKELGADYDADKWDKLLDQMTIEEQKQLVLHGYVQTREVNSIGKPVCNDVDGPNQIGSFNQKNVGTGYPNSTTLAQTWNAKLAYNMGIALGAEAKNLGYDGWYGPGLNCHRSPFGGRNYEYYSEDAFLNGDMAANAVKGAKNAGVYSYLKHLAVYDQESYRDGLYTWLTEQSFREIYLKPFEMAIQEGGATGVMTSYNRVGAVWAGGSTALLTGLLRNEWDFKGTVLTDYADHHDYMNIDQALRAGGDLWMDGWNNNGSFAQETTSNRFKATLREACKHIIYTYCNAYYTHSIYDPKDDEVSITIGTRKPPKETWKTIVYIVDGVVVAGLVTWCVLVSLPKKKKEE